MTTNSPTVRSRRLGRELRQLRDAKGLTLAEAGRRLIPRSSASRIQRIEAGIIKVRPGDVMELLGIYDADPDTRQSLEHLAGQVRQEGWWRDFEDVLTQRYLDYIGFEAEATRICAFELSVVPGLLQTRDYATALEQLTGADQAAIARKVEARLARQGLLDRTNPAVTMAVVLDEAVLHRIVGSRAVTRHQLLHLADTAEKHPDITIQVIPFSCGGHPGIGGPFAVLDFPDPADRSVAFGFAGAAVGGDRMFERPDEIDTLNTLFTDLRTLALDPDSSLDLIRKAAVPLGKAARKKTRSQPK